MKIGYICDQKVCVSGASNGIRMQAVTWKDALIKKGHDVQLIQPWGIYDWKSFDVIHVFSFGDSISFIDLLKQRGCKIVVSPIIDTIQSKFLYKLSSFWGVEKLRLTSPGYNLRRKCKYIDYMLARSEFEASYIKECFDFEKTKVSVIPLSFRSASSNCTINKEDFCLHVSSITQPRKNVMRLIKAAIKYNFKLVLAGSTGSEQSFAPFKSLISGKKNIEVLGFVSDEELEALYNKAKVFALPSINEGVGLVALEAAVHGCDVVITNIGGPKEYYSEYAYLVDPFSIDDIGQKIVAALSNSKQPSLQHYVTNNYNLEKCTDMLIEVYQKLLNE